MLALLGETCEEMLSLAETFERLSQKTDKKASTRASAASQAADWRNRYQTCLTDRQVKADPVVQQLQAQQQAAAMTAATGIPGGGSPTPQSDPAKRVLMWSGIFLAGSVGIYFLLKRRKGR